MAQNDLDSQARRREKGRRRRNGIHLWHLFQAFTQSGKLTKAQGWNPIPDASAKDGTTYQALFCDSCEKNYNNGNVRMAKEPVLV